MNENTKRDYQKYYVDSPKDFSPARNAYIINKTIKEYEAKRAAKYRMFNEALKERVSAVADYFNHLNSGKSTSVEKYFGKKELARLRGREVIKELRGETLPGKLIRWHIMSF